MKRIATTLGLALCLGVCAAVPASVASTTIGAGWVQEEDDDPCTEQVLTESQTEINEFYEAWVEASKYDPEGAETQEWAEKLATAKATLANIMSECGIEG